MSACEALEVAVYLLLMNCGTCQHVKQWRWLSTYYWWTVEHVSMWSTGAGSLFTIDELWNMSACETLEVAVYLLLMNCGTYQYVTQCRWLFTYYRCTVEYVKHCTCWWTIDELWNVDELLMNCGTCQQVKHCRWLSTYYWCTVEYAKHCSGCLLTI